MVPNRSVSKLQNFRSVVNNRWQWMQASSFLFLPSFDCYLLYLYFWKWYHKVHVWGKWKGYSWKNQGITNKLLSSTTYGFSSPIPPSSNIEPQVRSFAIPNTCPPLPWVRLRIRDPRGSTWTLTTIKIAMLLLRIRAIYMHVTNLLVLLDKEVIHWNAFAPEQTIGQLQSKGIYFDRIVLS